MRKVRATCTSSLRKAAVAFASAALIAIGGGASGSTGAGSSSSSARPSNMPAPAITSSSSLTVNEGIEGGFYTGKAQVASGRTARWSLSGTDANRFVIDSSTGELSFRSVPEYGRPQDANSDNIYRLTLEMSDDAESGTLDLSVQVLPWDHGGDRGMPLPPGPNDFPRPGGTAAKLKVLPWAGFKSAISYSFDDSSPSHIENWPALKAQRVRITFYVNPTANWFPGYDATWRDAVSQGSEIGNHTMHHCRASQLNGADYANCPNGYASAAEELDRTTAYITTHFGQSGVWTMAYPFGDLGYQAEAKRRFFMARGVFPGTVGAADTIDASNLPIIGHAGDPEVPGGDPVSVFNHDIDVLSRRGRWGIFLFHTLLPTAQNWGGGENVDVISANMRYAKGLGTTWIDSVANIGAYWAAQRLLEQARPSTIDGVTTWRWAVPPNFPPGRTLRVTVDGGTLSQNGVALLWNGSGFYEVSIDAGTLSWRQ